jgi:hypothetical protein
MDDHVRGGASGGGSDLRGFRSLAGDGARRTGTAAGTSFERMSDANKFCPLLEEEFGLRLVDFGVGVGVGVGLG